MHLTRAVDVVDALHGVQVPDPFRWLEDRSDEVERWQKERTEAARAMLAGLPARPALARRLQALWRYDDETVPHPCLTSPRIWYSTKRADQDKWVLRLREDPDDEAGRVVLDPNTWETTETLAGTWSSPDGRLLAYGVARAGDENPVVRVLEVDTGRVLPDRLSGWRQGAVSWLHDGSGFFYSCKPAAGEVPEGEEHYWHRARLHMLGADASDDRVVHAHPSVREYYHGAAVSEDGRHAVLYRSLFEKIEVDVLDLTGDLAAARPTRLVHGMDASYDVEVVEGRLIVVTDHEAPRARVMTTPVGRPGREHWVELIPEHPTDTLAYVSAVAGHLYAVYRHDAHTRVLVYTLDGALLHELPLPGKGTAAVWGHWGGDEVWVSFVSFAEPPASYRYDPATRALTLYRRTPIPVDVEGVTSEQVWFTSKDGTRVPMFLVHHRDAPRDGSVPVLLTGYGGFNISLLPQFSSIYATWVQAGGAVAIPNLRGGGEFGRAWHEAGQRERKQNVFDDFIAAAEWLIEAGWTTPSRLAIAGGSNGGLLVSAVALQRPDLFRAVLCQVPLADMLRFHRFGIASIWTQEYGNPDEPDMFEAIRRYSPYHNVVDGVDYPAMLITGSANDARTDPVHARKLYARLEQATGRGPDSERPLLLVVQEDSGHHGGVTIDTLVDQTADAYGFLMAQVGLTPRG